MTTRLTLSEAVHDQTNGPSRTAALPETNRFIGSGALARPTDPGPGLPFQTTPDRADHPLRPPATLAELVVHVIDGHERALNPAAITYERLAAYHVALHRPWAALER